MLTGKEAVKAGQRILTREQPDEGADQHRPVSCFGIKIADPDDRFLRKLTVKKLLELLLFERERLRRRKPFFQFLPDRAQASARVGPRIDVAAIDTSLPMQ